MARILTHTAIVSALLLAACGDDGPGTSNPIEEPSVVPSVEELAAMLLGPDDLGIGWTLEAPPEGAYPPDMDPAEMELAMTGVVTDSIRDLLPRIELCDAASDAAKASVENLRWEAFRPLDLTVEDTIQPPSDREGHMVFMQEFLVAGEPDELTATFDELRDGMHACLGEIPAGEEGPGVAEQMTVPEVGDDRTGVLMVVGEAGGWAEWRIHDVLVRDGTVLALFSIVDIRAGVEPYFTLDDIGEIVQIGVAKF